jgi:hypothetical protein
LRPLAASQLRVKSALILLTRTIARVYEKPQSVFSCEGTNDDSPAGRHVTRCDLDRRLTFSAYLRDTIRAGFDQCGQPLEPAGVRAASPLTYNPAY